MKKLLLILNLLGLLGSIIWLITDVSWEPLVTSIGLLASLTAQLYNNRNSDSKVIMTQKGGKNSKNYQSKGDINIHNND